MDPFEVSHLSDDSLLLDGMRLVGHGFKTDAMLLTRITEIDHRRLYRREGYASMYSFMIGEWHMSEDAAYKRIKRRARGATVPGRPGRAGRGPSPHEGGPDARSSPHHRER
jgi:hypothetical protein